MVALPTFPCATRRLGWAIATTTRRAAASVLTFNRMLLMLSFLLAHQHGRKCSLSNNVFATEFGCLMPLGSDPIRDRIDRAGLTKCPKPQDTALADAAGLRLAGIARPTYMEWRAQFNSQPDDLFLAHCNQGCFHPNNPFFRALLDELVESLIVGRPAVRITRAILLHCPNHHRLRPQHLGPPH